MKRSIVFLITAVSLVVAASAGAQATPQTTNVIVPLNTGGLPLCGGEEVVITGDQHIVVHQTTDSSGGQHLTFHTNFMHARATGVSTGRTYVVTDINHFSDNTSGPPPLEATQTKSGRIVGHGTPNTMVTIVLHTTINANGEVTSEVVKEEVRCGTGPQ